MKRMVPRLARLIVVAAYGGVICCRIDQWSQIKCLIDEVVRPILIKGINQQINIRS